MPDTAAPAPTDFAFPDALLPALLAVSLTGVNLLRPHYSPSGSLDDFAIEYLNPAGQRMTGLPERPGGTLRSHFPHTLAAGIVPFYRRVFETNQPETFDVNYQADGLDNYFRLAAQRHGEWLVVSFTDTADQNRSAVETALRESQAAEQQARAEADAQRQRFYDVLMQLPAQVATYHGPAHVYAFVNPRYQRYFPTHALLGRSIREALPEVEGQGIFDLLDRVYQTGVPYHGQEVEAWIDFTGTERPEQVFLNAFFHPLCDAQGRVDGVLDFSYDVTEQVRARRQLEQLNQELEARVQQRTQQAEATTQRLSEILRQAPALIATLEGPDHRFAFTNSGYDDLVGHRARLGVPVAECLPEVVAQGFVGLLDGVYRTGEAYVGRETPIEFQPPGGVSATYYLDFTYQPLRDAHGQTTGILAFVLDVTERVRARQHTEALQAEVLAAAQRQLQERESFYQVFAQTPAPVALLRTPAHRFEYVNAAYQAFFPNQLTGLEAAVAAPELVAQGFGALLDRVYHTGETYYGDELPFTPEPAPGQTTQTRYFSFTYQAYREAGDIVGVSIFALDVTDQVRARQEREAQRQQLDDLFLQAPAAIAILGGPALVYELVNPIYASLFPGRELPGRAIADVFPELAGTGVVETFQHVYQTGLANEERSLLIPFTNPATGQLEDRYFNYIQQARRDARGRVDGVLVFAFEVTDLVQAREQVEHLNRELASINEELAAINEEMQATNEELNDSNLQLTRTNVDLDNFIYTASHDLKAPISNLEGLLHLLREELPVDVVLADNVAPTLDFMFDAVERFKRTIDHLTEVSKLQKEHARATAAVDLAAVVEDVRLDLLPLLEATNAQLTVHLPDFPPVLFPEKNLRSVVYNLLSNALKYRHPDRRPHVELRGRVEPGFTVVEVHDNGLGLEPQHVAKLFGMFQRFHSHIEGTGIGLYMVKRMVENASGHIEVQSQPGAGTAFLVYLPHLPTV